jgi:hypothetical protein
VKDRKILIAMSALNIYELNSFVKYIHSPYFNVNQNIATFCTILAEAIKNNEENLLTPEIIWQKVFIDLPYNNQKFLKLNSDLVKLLEDFIAQKEFDQSDSFKTNLKIEGVRKRNMENLYSGIIHEIERLGKTELNQSAEYYLAKYQIEKNIFSLKTENEKKNEKFEITSALNIKDISDNLDFFYVAEKLRQYCTLLSWKKMYKLDIQIENIDNVIQLANVSPYNTIPSINIYYKMFSTYQDENNTENYFELRKLTQSYINIFPLEEQKEIYSTILGYCINKINKNQVDFFRETFEVYKDGIKENVLITDNSLSVTTYRNIVIAALRVEEFSWAENFIFEYAKYVNEKYRDNAVEFSLARLEFYKKNFKQVLTHLNNVNYEDVWYNINAKTIYLHAYYELDEFDALESLLQAFKMYIRREKSLSADRKVHYLNLIKFTSALMKLNAKEQPKVLKLKEEILATKGVVSKPWLLEKVEDMIKK